MATSHISIAEPPARLSFTRRKSGLLSLFLVCANLFVFCSFAVFAEHYDPEEDEEEVEKVNPNAMNLFFPLTFKCKSCVDCSS